MIPIEIEFGTRLQGQFLPVNSQTVRVTVTRDSLILTNTITRQREELKRIR